MIETRKIISTDQLTDALDEMQEQQESSEVRTFEVPADMHGERLDKILAQSISEFSRSYLQQLIETGFVRVDGQEVQKPSKKLLAGQGVQIELQPTEQSQAFKPEQMVLDIVYQDADVLVINKPAGLVVHPAPGNWSSTLLNGLLAFDPQCAMLPRAGIVHRLDKDTSGLMVVARNRQAMDALVRAIAARDVSRQYLALGHGNWQGNPDETVEASVGRDPRNRLRMAVLSASSTGAKSAKTDFHLIANAGEICFVRCVLYTGRTHQIRVHMAHIGHPLIGDITYGGKPLNEMHRQALHAFRLAFRQPVSGRDLSFEAPLPMDFQTLLKQCGLSYNAKRVT